VQVPGERGDHGGRVEELQSVPVEQVLFPAEGRLSAPFVQCNGPGGCGDAQQRAVMRREMHVQHSKWRRMSLDGLAAHTSMSEAYPPLEVASNE